MLLMEIKKMLIFILIKEFKRKETFNLTILDLFVDKLIKNDLANHDSIEDYHLRKESCRKRKVFYIIKLSACLLMTIKYAVLSNYHDTLLEVFWEISCSSIPPSIK